ncbi:hypothetical protein OH76DRAFT_338361 [Lentinus brumalis]|uniref:Uncharacterized protein n=1 Tax=Lentinus brumalis TaxID=2498619 RepID=A0A371CJG4_9APHY|nr:hypothetical protein OH76DRAFT_338361 [Polyporus brumalis]
MQGLFRTAPPLRVTSLRGPKLSYVRTQFRSYAASSRSDPLPPSFLSLYRLFLRSTAASVLSQPKATAVLRQTWRPVFSQAAAVMRHLESGDAPPEQRRALTNWLTEWEKRVDKTLSLLYSSAVTRGLPHQVTRNLYLMTVANQNVIDPPPFLLGGGVWNGQLPPGDPYYQPPKTPKSKTPQQRARERFTGRSLHALSDVIGMAEGSVGVLLGRLQRRR